MVEVNPWEVSMRDEVPWDRDELTVGELSARSGVSVSALRFYERQGLITSRRTSGNQRRYRRDTLRRIAFVRVSQRVGIPLAAIGEALATLPADHAPGPKDWRRLSRAWKADLDARIAQLERLRDHLTDCIGCGCLTLRKCALNNPHDALGREGPGPRTLLVEPYPGETGPVEHEAVSGRSAEAGRGAASD